MKSRLFVTLTLFVLMSGGLGCGGGDNNATPAPQAETVAPKPSAPAPAPEPPAAPATPDAQGIVHLTASDLMRYSHTRIEVKAGDKIKIELKNLGTLGKETMGHNLVLLKAPTTPADFGSKAAGAKATDYIPTDAADMMIAHTKLLGPGESDTVEIDALPAGTYTYMCSFPGHFALMTGQLVVQ